MSDAKNFSCNFEELGIRVSEEEEYNGMDVSEFGLHAYPEFVERQGA